MKRKVEKIISTLSIVLAVCCLMAGCTPDSSKKDTQGKQETENRQETNDMQKTEEPEEDSDTQKNDHPAENADTQKNDTSEEASDTQKTEVSREDFPDCDGSGHGYIEIHYSDGSVEIEEY